MIVSWFDFYVVWLGFASTPTVGNKYMFYSTSDHNCNVLTKRQGQQRKFFFLHILSCSRWKMKNHKSWNIPSVSLYFFTWVFFLYSWIWKHLTGSNNLNRGAIIRSTVISCTSDNIFFSYFRYCVFAVCLVYIVTVLLPENLPAHLQLSV